MPNPGEFVLKDDGTFGLKSDGTFAVYDASGECSDCCGAECCSYNSGSPRNSVIAALETSPSSIEPTGSYYHRSFDDDGVLDSYERIVDISDLSAYASADTALIGTAGGCVYSFLKSFVYTNAGTDYFAGELNATFDVRIGFLFHLDFQIGMRVGEMNFATTPDFIPGNSVSWGDGDEMPSITCDETAITLTPNVLFGPGTWDTLSGSMTSGRHIPIASGSGSTTEIVSGTTFEEEFDHDVTITLRDGSSNILTPSACPSVLADVLDDIGC
jgi:hypothetical protein